MIPLEKATIRANEVKDALTPFCERIEIAGSIRRKRPQVKDIEIVCIPKPYETGLFESGIATVVNRWKKVKGELNYGKCKYTQRILPSGVKIDIFFATEVNWGYILAIRTGSADYNHKVLASGWVKKGYKGVDGNLTANGRVVPVKEEGDLFKIVGTPYIDPINRNL